MSDYERGYRDGFRDGSGAYTDVALREAESILDRNPVIRARRKKQRPSAWNKFVKANSKKKKFIYQSGANKGKLNLKKMGVAWRKTAAGKKKR
jgi:hypothetical protein